MSENNQKVNNYEEIYKKYPQLVDILLLDMTRKHCDFPISSDIRNNVSEKERDKCKYNIIWATEGYTKNILTPLTSTSVGENGYKIVPRCDKAKDEQIKRTKDKAEVFTPSWICNKQNNIIDNQRFLEKGLYTQDEIEKNGIFNKENITHQDVTIKNNTKTIEIHNWDTNENTIKFNSNYKWTDYINENVIEITCGEAPYLVSRYDTVNGDVIDIKRRIGLLDRKLRIINENAKNDKEWKEWIIKAYRHTYGFEWQGDNLLLARKNLLNTFIDYYYQRFNEFPSSDFLEEIAKIISWNIWQMDGLKCVIPLSCTPPESGDKKMSSKTDLSKLIKLCQEVKNTNDSLEKDLSEILRLSLQLTSKNELNIDIDSINELILDIQEKGELTTQEQTFIDKLDKIKETCPGCKESDIIKACLPENLKNQPGLAAFRQTAKLVKGLHNGIPCYIMDWEKNKKIYFGETLV